MEITKREEKTEGEETASVKDLRSLSREELRRLITELSEKGYRGDQMYTWMHGHYREDIDEMGNIPKVLKKKLSDNNYGILPVKKELVRVSETDGTRKYLFRLYDGNMIESVFMKYEHGNSVCVSSQVGCRMGCRFCASTIEGLVRNLTAGEMLGQIYGIIRDTGEKISNTVIMGSGEPLDNYDNAIRFIRLLTDEDGLNISQRNVTLSTCGIVPMIKRLKEEDLKITLAVSLHAPNDDIRKEIMPIANKYPMNSIMEACRDYYDANKRRLTFEYSLIRDVNDSEEDALELASLLKGMNAHVNLIPVNPVEERDYRQSEHSRIHAFQNKLEKNHINVTIRRDLGRDIDGACGQLRRRYLRNSE
ncbi:MAG: 23S rRNA (adenine(2503)-C(2))-methyltransferase RlmN [Lachnospiraceae bacterium]|nr:23S rRNA (adenine(2503)-C(2))-methyltransferase RlmN [Lachnospiraceae bacterium]